QCQGGIGQSAGARSPSGQLWFLTARGAAFVDPQRLPRARQAPPAIVESVRFDDALQPLFPAPRDWRFPPGRGALQFAYPALWLARPEKLRFRYRLDPFDRGWVEAGDRRVAFYTQVPPGHYRF